MTDVQIAARNLHGHTLCLCRDGNCLYGDQKGILSLMQRIEDGTDLSGYSAADVIVGKAVAMLFVRCGIRAVFAETLSRGGQEVLQKHGIPYTYRTLTDGIRNRAGTDACPMEKAVSDTDDIEEAYRRLHDRVFPA